MEKVNAGDDDDECMESNAIEIDMTWCLSVEDGDDVRAGTLL